jgi:hypothetical protein
MNAAYESMVHERMANYNTTREVVERAAKAFWTTNKSDDPSAYADSLEVRAAVGGTSFTLDDYLSYFSKKSSEFLQLQSEKNAGSSH